MAGLQVEVGSVATDFEFEDYGTTLQKCQRYLHRLSKGDGTGARMGISVGMFYSTTYLFSDWRYPNTMRAAPTMSYSAVGDFVILDVDANETVTAIATDGAAQIDYAPLVFTHSGTVTDGDAGFVRFDVEHTGYIQFSAEL
jgi:hypothetical protein